MKHILVGFDGSTNGRRALEEALDVARADTRITIVAAAQAPAPPGQVLPAGAEGLEERQRELEDARRHLAQLGRDAEVVAVSGAPADVLVEEAEKRGADLIVVGRRGLNGAERLVMGSVSSKVVRTARCSVLIARWPLSHRYVRLWRFAWHSPRTLAQGERSRFGLLVELRPGTPVAASSAQLRNLGRGQLPKPLSAMVGLLVSATGGSGDREPFGGRAAEPGTDREELEAAEARGEKVGRGLSNNSINHTLSDLAQVLETAVEYGLLVVNRPRGSGDG